MIHVSKARSSRVPDVKTLTTDPSYQLVEELPFQEMITFVLTNIRGRGIMPLVFLGTNIAMAGLILFLILTGVLEGTLVWKKLVVQSLLGIFSGTILVVPVHELLHGLVYRVMGAKRIKFGVDLQQFIFFVTADRYPVSGRQLYVLALTPFVVINSVTILVTIFFVPDTLFWPAFFLLSHNLMCIGDFAIANYISRAKWKIFTFDVLEEKKSYFYKEVR